MQPYQIQRSRSFAVLSIMLSWVSSSQAQMITENNPPTGPTVVGIFETEADGSSTFVAISTLSSPIPTATSLGIAGSSSLSSPAASSTSDTDDSTNPHLSSPVAVVAGVLAGLIAIFAAFLVFFVARRRRKKNRRMLHATLHHSYAVAAARARAGDAEGGLAEDSDLGVLSDRDLRRLSSSRFSSSPGPSLPPSRPHTRTKTSRHTTSKITFEDDAAPTRRLHPTSDVPMIIVTASRSPSRGSALPRSPPRRSHSRQGSSGSSTASKTINGVGSNASRSTTPALTSSSDTSSNSAQSATVGSSLTLGSLGENAHEEKERLKASEERVWKMNLSSPVASVDHLPLSHDARAEVVSTAADGHAHSNSNSGPLQRLQDSDFSDDLPPAYDDVR